MERERGSPALESGGLHEHEGASRGSNEHDRDCEDVA